VQRSPVSAPVPSVSISGAAGSPPRDASWEHRLREREHRELAPRVRALAAQSGEGADGLRPSLSGAAVAPTVGARLSLNVNASQACADPDWRTGEVMAVTRTAIVVADVDNPAGGFTPAEYAAFGVSFDDRVFPVVTSNFGMPSDIDGNGRVVIFFTRAVNEMSHGATSVVGGFFFSRDLFARSGSGSQQTCAGSNQAEILYLMVPDPVRAASDAAFSKAGVQRNAVAVLAHELQHLVNASHRLFVKRSGSFEETWLNEGLSHIAEELVGNHAAGIGRRENVDYARLRGSSETWEMFTLFHRSNFARLGLHLQQPGGSGLFDATGSLAGRGAAWQFLRYAADRAGGDEATLWRALTGGPSTGMRNLERVFGVHVAHWMRDWAISVHTDDVFPDIDPVWRQPSWNYRSVFGGIRGDGSYPLDFRALPAEGGVDVAVAAGGAAYLGFGVPANGRTEVRTSWGGGLTPPHRLLISVVRTR